MGLFLLLAVVMTFAAGCSTKAAGAATGPSETAQLRPIVALGDSLTSGRGLSPDQAYPAVLERMLRAAGLPYDVVNHGVSGDTTARALQRLDAALNEEPSILIVALGANDGLRGVPIAQVRAHLETIIEAAQRRNIAILLCGMDALPLYGWDYTAAFHDLYPALAEKYNVPLVPFLLEGVVANQAMLQPDFVHPNAAGAARIAQTIWTYLQPLAVKTAAADVRASGPYSLKYYRFDGPGCGRPSGSALALYCSDGCNDESCGPGRRRT